MPPETAIPYGPEPDVGRLHSVMVEASTCRCRLRMDRAIAKSNDAVLTRLDRLFTWSPSNSAMPVPGHCPLASHRLSCRILELALRVSQPTGLLALGLALAPLLGRGARARVQRIDEQSRTANPWRSREIDNYVYSKSQQRG